MPNHGGTDRTEFHGKFSVFQCLCGPVFFDDKFWKHCCLKMSSSVKHFISYLFLGWDATNLNNGDPVSAGTYYYIIKYSGVGGAQNQIQGFVEILR